MQIRKDLLANNEYYHVFSRSIAGYIIFNDTSEFNRLFELLRLYRHSDFEYKYSQFTSLNLTSQLSIIRQLNEQNDLLVEIIAYCIMPTHVHLILKQIKDNGISKFMARVLNGYARYFNTKHKRQGALWAGRFKNVLIKDDIQLLHLTRYIHLNPTSIGLVENPENWPNSSYPEYVDADFAETKICNFENLFDLDHKKYKQFVLDRKDYQKQISIIKTMLIDDYTG